MEKEQHNTNFQVVLHCCGSWIPSQMGARYNLRGKITLQSLLGCCYIMLCFLGVLSWDVFHYSDLWPFLHWHSWEVLLEYSFSIFQTSSLYNCTAGFYVSLIEFFLMLFPLIGICSKEIGEARIATITKKEASMMAGLKSLAGSRLIENSWVVYTARPVYNKVTLVSTIKLSTISTTFSDGMKVPSIQHKHESRHACFGREGWHDGTLLFWCREPDMPCRDFRDGIDHPILCAAAVQCLARLATNPWARVRSRTRTVWTSPRFSSFTGR